MKKEKVLHVITVSFVINHFFGKQFLYLKKKTGNEYHLACSYSKDFIDLSNQLNFIPFEVEITRRISPLKDIAAIIKLYIYIKKNKITKVIGHTPKGALVAMIASYFARLSDRIYFRHGLIYETRFGYKKIILKNIERLTGFLATQVVCVSNSVKILSEKDKLNSPQKNIVLGLGTCNGIDTLGKYNPNFIDINEKKMLESKLDIGGHKIVGYVGRLVKDKGIDELILAWEKIIEKYPKVKLLLVGPIENRDEISSYSKNFIFTNQSVIFTDYVSDASPYFSLIDIFILPTFREGFPTVALEASSMEIPVLITKATGCTEAIVDGWSGKFITHSIDDIAEKVLFYLNNEAIAKQHGKQGRIFVSDNFEEKFIWDSLVRQLKI